MAISRHLLGIFSVSLMIAIIHGQDTTPQCKTRKYEIIAKSDCKGYYLCVYGKPVEMPDCPTGSVFSTTGHVCVPKGSYYDDCKPKQVPPTEITDTRPTLPDLGPLSIEEQCSLYGGIIPHPTECHAYYNCSNKYEIIPRYYEQFLQECQYLQLFDSESKECKHFELVKCGNREEYKDACEYRRNKCPVAPCIPCHVRIPSCEGKPDGINAHESKRWSPYYAVCYKERTVSEETCPPDQDGRTQLFHPDRSLCVPLEQIPRQYGGLMPDCAGRYDAHYLGDFGRCDQYTICRSEEFVDTVKCVKGETFDLFNQKCMPVERTCGPCGNRDDC